jgi:Ca2+-binding RTX toxin-like protein
MTFGFPADGKDYFHFFNELIPGDSPMISSVPGVNEAAVSTTAITEQFAQFNSPFEAPATNVGHIDGQFDFKHTVEMRHSESLSHDANAHGELDYQIERSVFTRAPVANNLYVLSAVPAPSVGLNSSFALPHPGDGYADPFQLGMPSIIGGSVLHNLSIPSAFHPPLAVPQNPISATGGGFHINLIYDSAALAAPQSFRDGIQAAANILEAAISDNITVNLAIHYSGTGGGAFAGPDNGLAESYSSIRADLINGATPGDHTFDDLPTGTTIGGQSQVDVWNAQLKLFGLLSANDTTTDDGSATFATDIESDALVGVALHELTHALGRIPDGAPYSSNPDIFDFFRFTSAGDILIDDNIPASASAYFSIDGGNTKLADYGVSSDPSDFLNSGVQGANDPFNEYYTPGSTLQTLTAVDLQQLDALGFHLVGSGPDLVAINAAVSGTSFSVTIKNVGGSSAGASTTGIYLSTDSTITTSDILLTTIATGGLAAGASVGESKAISFSGSQTPGTYYIGAYADEAGAVSEGNENNNASLAIPVILGDNNANTINGTSGDDMIFGLAGNDGIHPGLGNDTVNAGDGNDIISFSGGRLNAADKIDGGAGFDTVLLNGDYTGANAVSFTSTTMVNVEKIAVGAGSSYSLTTNDATVGSGQTLTVDASALGASNSLTFNGAAETNGSFVITGGAGADSLTGGAGNDTINGGAGNDVFHPGLGNDTVNAGDGNDIISFGGGRLNAADKIDGGTGTDAVLLGGDYTGGNAVSFTATTMVNVEKIAVGAGSSYSLTTNDATVASGQTLTVDGSALGSSNSLTFNGAAETNGSFVITGGAGADSLTGGAGNDTINGGAGNDGIHPGLGNDTVNAGDGNDIISFSGGRLNAADKIDGGAGFDTVLLNGDYTGANAVSFTSTTMVNVEKIAVGAGSSYSLTTNDATVGSGQTLTVDASALGASNSLTFNGAAETNGHFLIDSGLGADNLTGGALSDTFVYASAADSTSTHYDTINGFNFSLDRFDIPGAAGSITAIDAAVSNTLSTGSFDTDLAAAVSGHLNPHTAMLVTANAGSLSGQTFLIVDINGAAGYQTGSDLVFHLTSQTGTLATGDFI